MNRAVRLLAARELRDSVRSYWFLLTAGLFVVGGVLLLLFGQADAAVLGYRGYGRALAGLMQLALFFVPLMALFPASAALAGEREVGSLDYLLAQPVTRGEVFAGKWTGVAAAVTLALLVGYGLTGAVAGAQGVPAVPILLLLAFTLLLGLTFVSLGLWLSALVETRGRATSLALSAWLFLLALGSLGLMGSLVRWNVEPWVLQAWALVDPVEAFRMAMIVVLDPEAHVLGPVGSSMVETLGRGPLVGLSAASLLLWSGVACVAGLRAFGGLRRSGRSEPGREGIGARGKSDDYAERHAA